MSGKTPLEKAVLNLDVKATLRIINKLTKKEGWKSVFSQIRKHLNKIVGKAWYARNWFYLSILDSVGLMGIDTDVEKILVRLDDEFDFSKKYELKLHFDSPSTVNFYLHSFREQKNHYQIALFFYPLP